MRGAERRGGGELHYKPSVTNKKANLAEPIGEKMSRHTCSECGDPTPQLYPSAAYFRRHNIPVAQRKEMKTYCRACWNRVSGDLNGGTSRTIKNKDDIKTLTAFSRLSPKEREIFTKMYKQFPQGAYSTTIAKICGYRRPQQVMPILHRMIKKGALIRLPKGYKVNIERQDEMVVPTMQELRCMGLLAKEPLGTEELVNLLQTTKDNFYFLVHNLKKKGWVVNIGGMPAEYELTHQGKDSYIKYKAQDEMRELLGKKYVYFRVRETIEVADNWVLQPREENYSLPTEQFFELAKKVGLDSLEVHR